MIILPCSGPVDARDRWSEKDARLYQRHPWRSEGFHGEAKCWHGLARAIRRGLQNMRVQAFLTAMAVNLKRLAAALALLWAALSVILAGSAGSQSDKCEEAAAVA